MAFTKSLCPVYLHLKKCQNGPFSLHPERFYLWHYEHTSQVEGQYSHRICWRPLEFPLTYTGLSPSTFTGLLPSRTRIGLSLHGVSKLV